LLKHSILSVDRSNPRRVVFNFERSPQLLADLKKIDANQILVKPFEFWNTQRRCKQLIYREGPYGD
jgi:hypothetical protein